MPLPLFILGSGTPSSTLLSNLRNTSYISEITSGESAPDESGLWTLLSVVPSSLSPSSSDPAFSDPQALLKFALEKLEGQKTEDGQSWEVLAIVVADSTTDKDGSFLVIELKGKDQVKDSLRVAAGSVLEVASNLHVSNMAISEFRNMSGNAPIYDAGYAGLS